MRCGASMRHSSFRAAIAAVALLSFTPAVAAAPAKGDAPVTEAELAAHIKILADDAFEGRAPGTDGEDRTIAWIAWLIAPRSMPSGSLSSCARSLSPAIRPVTAGSAAMSRAA